MHLSDCFINTLAYLTYFIKIVETKQPDHAQVKADFHRLLQEGDALFCQGNFSRDEYDLARFAVCALVDEVLLRSPWVHRSLWLRDQLQRNYYNTTDAGEEFFDRLSSLGLHQRGVREVYYLCLALGFTGRYCHAGDEYHLEQIKTSNLKLLLGSSVGLPSLKRTDLFPEAHPSGFADPGHKQGKGGTRVVSSICFVGPVLLFILLYLIYRFTLGGVGDSFLRSVGT